MDINHALKQGWNTFTKDLVILLLASLITTALTVVTLGVLGGPLAAGFFSMVLGRARDNRPADLGDLFRHFDRFGDYLLGFYVLFFGITLGIILLIIPGIYLGSIWIYVFPLMVDKKLRLSDALTESAKLVNQNGLMPHVGLILILGAIQAILNKVSHGFAGVFIMPFNICCVVTAYLEVSAHSVDSQPQRV